MKKIILLTACLAAITARAQIAPADTLTLTYTTYMEIVGKENLSWMAEKYNVQIADAGARAEKVFVDPELSFEASEDDFSVELGFTLEMGKRRARVRMARSEAELERLAFDYFCLELRAEATDAFLEALLQKQLLEVKRSSYQQMYRLSQSDSIRLSLGEIDENEARQSRLEAVTLLNEVYGQEAEYYSALATLREFMGTDLNQAVTPATTGKLPQVNYRLSDLIETALLNRADLTAAIKGVEVAGNRLKLARAERRIDMGLFVGYEKDWGNGVLPKDDRLLKGGVAIPLKFSNRNRGTLQAARYGIQQSEVQLREAELQIRTEVTQAYYQYEATRRQLEQYQAGMLEDSDKLIAGVVYMYQRGETSILDVLIAQRTYNDIQEEYLQTLKDYASSLVELQRVCGVWELRF